MEYIKTFESFINNYEVLNEAEQISDDILEQVKNALPELEKLILKQSKVKAKLYAEIGGNKNIKITSEDLSNQLCPLGKTIFTRISIDFWGGILTKDGTVWFNPKLKYNHPSGGSNGADFIWDSLWYNPETSKWIEGRKL